jgi:transcriptional regulator with PAS, ATPase and Fis domain
MLRPSAARPAEPAAILAPRRVLLDRLVCLTPSLAPLVPRLEVAVAHDVTVLLTGESGTGKSYLARLLHDFSPRRVEPFLAIPCGALAANLVDSELFGHVKGAFTGATEHKQGKFAAAGQGTILLDDIDALRPEQQVKLLRVVETGEFEPVGSNETQRCRARVIAASNLDVARAVERTEFRSDLYFRLNIFSFDLPPLRQRVQDIGPLARELVSRFSARFGKEVPELRGDTLRLLEAYPWPGNIRQLEHSVLHAVLTAGRQLLPTHFQAALTGHGHADSRSRGPRPESLTQSNADAEREFILRTLRRHGFCRKRTARTLGISRQALYVKMKKHGLSSNPPGAEALRWRPGSRHVAG